MSELEDANFSRFLIKNRVPFGEAMPTIFKGYMSAYRDVLRHVGNDQRPMISDDEFSALVNSHFYRYVSELSNHFDPHLANGPGTNSLRVQERSSPPPRRPSRYSLILGRMFLRSHSLTRRLRDSRTKIPNKREHSDPREQPTLIYSPLFFCRQILTSPAFLASEALAHAVIRGFLFEETLNFERWLRYRPNARNAQPPEQRPEEENGNAYVRIRDIISFENVEQSLRKIESFIRNRDNLPLKNGTDFIVSHMLASKGLLMLRFEGPDGFIDPGNDDRNPSLTLESFLSGGKLVPDLGFYQFEKPKEVRSLPTAAELINDLDGLPLALPGASHIFQGGLRFTTQSGVLSRFYGPPGIGKTSFALALAASLAPLGTQTIYLSCEEQSSDLIHRIRTLVPPFIKRTQSYRDPKDWFSSHFVRGSFNEKRDQILLFLDEAIQRFSGKLPNPENSPPGLMPLLIVLDGIHEMFPSSGDDTVGEGLRQLIAKCQATGALVVAMSAEHVRSDLAEFDYLVDIVAALEYSPLRDEMNPPSRIFNLRKTRRQLARTGAHGLDLSSEENGVTLHPYIHAFLDESRGRFWVEPSDSHVVDFLLKRDGYLPSGSKGEGTELPLVKLKDRSQVLVMGRGSSGKSLFGLRLLGSPFVGDERLSELIEKRREQAAARRSPTLGLSRQVGAQQDDDDPWFEEVDPSGRRILVLSFLYQAPYYEKLKRTQRHWNRDSVGRLGQIRLQLDVEHFSPGFLRPEEFIDRVVTQIEAAELEGVQYHGVLLDGVHNVFLQFPSLEASEIVWPTLYEILRVKGLAVVTTHTYFDVSEYGSVMQDLEASRRRVAPLLHALVQSSDYVLKIHPVASLLRDGGDFALTARTHFDLNERSRRLPQNLTYRPPEAARYLVEVPGALDQSFVEPPVDWGWDRDRGTMFQVRKAADLALAVKVEGGPTPVPEPRTVERATKLRGSSKRS